MPCLLILLGSFIPKVLAQHDDQDEVDHAKQHVASCSCIHGILLHIADINGADGDLGDELQQFNRQTEEVW